MRRSSPSSLFLCLFRLLEKLVGFVAGNILFHVSSATMVNVKIASILTNWWSDSTFHVDQMLMCLNHLAMLYNILTLP